MYEQVVNIKHGSNVHTRPLFHMILGLPVEKEGYLQTLEPFQNSTERKARLPLIGTLVPPLPSTKGTLDVGLSRTCLVYS